MNHSLVTVMISSWLLERLMGGYCVKDDSISTFPVLIWNGYCRDMVGNYSSLNRYL
jgi:hypothetical protein